MGLCNAQTGYETIYVHPTFLYESLWNLVGFILINIFYKKRKYHGEVTLWYFAWYGLGRGFIELLRTDSLMLGSIRVSSLLSFLLFAALVPLLLVLRVRYEKLAKSGSIEYQEVVTIPMLLGISRRKADTSDTGSKVVPEAQAESAEQTCGSATGKEYWPQRKHLRCRQNRIRIQPSPRRVLRIRFRQELRMHLRRPRTP